MNNKSRIVKSLTIIISVVIVAILISTTCIIHSIVIDKISGKQTYFLGLKPIVVITGSMEPAIMTNSISIVKRCSIEDVYIGDVVMYIHNNGMIITHRVIEFTKVDGKTAIITKGDANEGRDILPVTDDNLEGKIIWTDNSISFIINSITNTGLLNNAWVVIKWIYILLVLIGIAIIVVSILLRILKGIYWTIVGDSKFNRVIAKYKNNTIKIGRVSSILSTTNQIDGEKVNILGKLILGLYRSKVVGELKDLDKNLRKLSRKTRRYHKVYRNLHDATIDLGNIHMDD